MQFIQYLNTVLGHLGFLADQRWLDGVEEKCDTFLLIGAEERYYDHVDVAGDVSQKCVDWVK